MELSLEALETIYKNYEKSTDSLLKNLREMEEELDESDLDLVGLSTNVMAEAFLMLQTTFELLRSTRKTSGTPHGELAKQIYIVSKILHSMVIQYIDDNGLDHDTINCLCQDELNEITLVDYSDVQDLIIKYLTRYAEVTKGAKSVGSILSEYLYKHE